MVGYYFEKRRALATGIACCGSGIGAFVFAPLCNYLSELYGWRGAVWILSAVVLNGLVFSVFYRPIEPGKVSQGDTADSMENGDPSRPLLEDEGKGEREEGDGGGGGGESTVVTPESAVVKTHSRSDAVGDSKGPGSPSSEPSSVTQADTVKGEGGEKNGDAKTVSLEQVDLQTHKDALQGGGGQETGGVKQDDLSEFFQTVVPEIHHVQSADSKTFMSDFHIKSSGSPAGGRSSGGGTGGGQDQVLARMAFSQGALVPTDFKKRHPAHHHRHHHHHHPHQPSETNNPLRRRDIFYSGSLRNLPEYQSSGNLVDYRRKVTSCHEDPVVEELETRKGEKEEEEEWNGGSVGSSGGRVAWLWRLVCHSLRRVFDLSLLRSPTFIIYGFSCFLCMLGQCVASGVVVVVVCVVVVVVVVCVVAVVVAVIVHVGGGGDGGVV